MIVANGYTDDDIPIHTRMPIYATGKVVMQLEPQGGEARSAFVGGGKSQGRVEHLGKMLLGIRVGVN